MSAPETKESVLEEVRSTHVEGCALLPTVLQHRGEAASTVDNAIKLASCGKHNDALMEMHAAHEQMCAAYDALLKVAVLFAKRGELLVKWMELAMKEPRS